MKHLRSLSKFFILFAIVLEELETNTKNFIHYCSRPFIVKKKSNNALVKRGKRLGGAVVNALVKRGNGGGVDALAKQGTFFLEGALS